MHFVEYAKFQVNVREFLDAEGLQGLLVGSPPSCVKCGGSWDADGLCQGCEASLGEQDQPWTSDEPCDCCGTLVSGDRHHTSGYNHASPARTRGWFAICDNCVTYIAEGCLDDQNMAEVESTRGKAEEAVAEGDIFVEPPDENGDMRVSDGNGNLVEVYAAGSTEWWDWIDEFV